MKILNLTRGSHPGCRFIAGCGLLLAAIACHSIWSSLIYFMLSITLIYLLEGGWKTIIRLLKLLRWFVIPIVLLHALLSPGQLMLPALQLPLTWEGIHQGVWLSVHLATIFASALLLSRLLLRSEWISGMMMLPFAGKRLIVFQMMLSAMRINISNQLRHLKWQWQLRTDWRQVAVFLLACFRMTLQAGREQAQVLWLRWPTQGNGMHASLTLSEQSASFSSLISLSWLSTGLIGMVLAWL